MNVKHRISKEKNPYLDRVKRLAIRAGMLGADYENAVVNRRETEGHPEPEAFTPKVCGTVLANTWMEMGLVRHNERKTSHGVYPRHDAEGTVQVQDSMWLCDGKEIDVELLKPYLPPVKEGTPKQETERAVPWRVIAVENIAQI